VVLVQESKGRINHAKIFINFGKDAQDDQLKMWIAMTYATFTLPLGAPSGEINLSLRTLKLRPDRGPKRATWTFPN
jgi:hypothetical protein